MAAFVGMVVSALKLRSLKSQESVALLEIKKTMLCGILYIILVCVAVFVYHVNSREERNRFTAS